MKKRLSWWMLPSLITGGLAALGVLGTIAINYATFAGLPKRVEAAEEENAQQDKLLDKLGYIAQQNQQLMSQQLNPVRVWESQDTSGQWWRCDAPTEQVCWDERRWERE